MVREARPGVRGEDRKEESGEDFSMGTKRKMRHWILKNGRNFLVASNYEEPQTLVTCSPG